MSLIELHEAFSGGAILIEEGDIGEVRDLSAKRSWDLARCGRTLIRHRHRPSKFWRVVESYERVRELIAEARHGRAGGLAGGMGLVLRDDCPPRGGGPGPPRSRAAEGSPADQRVEPGRPESDGPPW